MRIFGVSAPQNVQTSGDYRESYVYQSFYHGDWPPQGQNRYGERPYKTLKVTRRLGFDPAVTFPSIVMVLRRTLAEELGPLAHVDYHGATLHSVYDYPADERAVRAVLSQCSVFDDSFDRWRDRRSRKPTAAEKRAFDCVEVIVPNLVVVGKQYPTLTRKRPRRLTESCKPLTIFTSAAIHKEYPIIRDEGIYWMGEAEFSKMKPHVDQPHLFALYEFDIC